MNTNKQIGFSIIEIMVVITLSALLLGLGTFSYRGWIIQQRVFNDTQTIFHALNTARELAMLHGFPMSVCGDEACEKPWESQLLINALQRYSLTHYNIITIKAFPQSRNQYIRFHPNGFTDAQNASIYICPSDETQFAKKVVINQAGRVYVSNDDAEENC